MRRRRAKEISVPFTVSPGQFLVRVLKAAFRAALGLIALIWIVLVLWISWKLVTFGIAYLGRTIFQNPW